MMATVYNAERQPIGKVKPHRSGAIAAFDGKRRCLGLFTSESLAIMALMDCADKPIEAEIWIEWVAAIVASLSLPNLDALTEPGHLVEQPPVRMVMEILLNPW